MSNEPVVVTIVLNWKNKIDTMNCISSLSNLDYQNNLTILVDNFSQDGIIAAVAAQYPGIRVIENKSNLGYAGGNNVGIACALQLQPDYVFVLNNDTFLDPTCLSRLVFDMGASPRIAAAGPKILYADFPRLINFAGGALDSHGLPYHVGVRHPNDASQFRDSVDTVWLTGCAILFRREALESVGLFDKRYFLLYEDVDWCMRANRKGYRLRWVADATLWHKESASFGRTWSPNYFYYFCRNRFLFLERNSEKRLWPRRFRHAFDSLSYLIRTEIVSQGYGDELFWRRIMWRGVADYVLRRFGERQYVWN